jgi:cation transport ATPase
VELVAAAGRTTDEVLMLAGSMERHSEHPLAHAILERAKTLSFEPAARFENVDGMGAKGRVDGEAVLIGNRRLMSRSVAKAEGDRSNARSRRADCSVTGPVRSSTVKWPWVIVEATPGLQLQQQPPPRRVPGPP